MTKIESIMFWMILELMIRNLWNMNALENVNCWNVFWTCITYQIQLDTNKLEWLCLILGWLPIWCNWLNVILARYKDAYGTLQSWKFVGAFMIRDNHILTTRMAIRPSQTLGPRTQPAASRVCESYRVRPMAQQLARLCVRLRGRLRGRFCVCVPHFRQQ